MSKMDNSQDLSRIIEGGISVSAELGSEDQRKKIAERAYALFEKRGGAEGFDLQDWLQAEREVLAQQDIH